MFRWHQELYRLDIPATQVLHLERSLSNVQVAPPGFPSQEATAYLCAFAVGKGVRLAVALHLHTSRHLAFYLHDREESPRREVGRLIEEGLRFAESMGFMLGNLDFRDLDAGARIALWNSLPLKEGMAPPVPSAGNEPPGAERTSPGVLQSPPPPMEPVEKPIKKPIERSVAKLVERPPAEKPIEKPAEKPVTKPVVPEPPAPLGPAGVGGLSDFLTEGDDPFPPPKTRKRLPSAEELTARRLKLRENLGRFLASL